MKLKNYLAFFFLPFMAICANAQTGTVSTQTLSLNGTTRSMLVYCPRVLAKNRPLVLSLHGMNQDPNWQRSHCNWDLVADTAKFLVVYPQGINNSWDTSGMTDVDFMAAIIKKMYNSYHIDTTRVYLNGFSMGAMFTYEAALKRAHIFAAFAPCSGYPLYDVNNFQSSRPVPIIAIQGMSDDVFKPNDIPPYVEKWARRDGCNMTPTVTSPYYPPYATRGYYAVPTKKVWNDGKYGTKVELITITNKGHWYCDDPGCLLASVEIWNFVKDYTTKLGQSTAVENTTMSSTKEIKSEKVYNLEGQEVAQGNGLHIIKKIFTDGSSETEKRIR
jgi:poly(3-hydroxybutyrate) depolymerase